MFQATLRFLLLTCTIFCSFFAVAQVSPVNVTTIIRPPYSLNLSDYAAPGYNRIQANLFMADITQLNYPVKIRLIIKGEGDVLLRTTEGNEAGPFYLNGGQTTTLTGYDLNKLFNPQILQFSGISYQQYRLNSALPEGYYQIQFEVIDAKFNIPLSNANIGFGSAWLLLNDPPIINLPANTTTITPTPAQNILFQWTPRHTGSPNAAFTTVYDIKMVEIYPTGRNANDAILTSPPIFEQNNLYATSYNYSIIDPNLIPNKWYAFVLRARDAEGKDMFKNQGFSEVYSFYYGESCAAPNNLRVDALDATSALVYWDNQIANLSAEVQYKTASGTKWNSIVTNSNSITVPNLKTGETYVFKVMGKCANNNSNFSEEVKYTIGGSSTVGKECDIPTNELVTSTATSLTNAEINWNSLPWFTDYVFKYRLLGTASFTEVASNTNKITLTNLDYDRIYEYQILYHCKTGVWVNGKTNTFKTTVPVSVLKGTGTDTGDCFPPLDITNTVKEDLTVTINWPKDRDVSAYRVYWRQDVASTSWDSVQVNGTSTTLQKLQANTDYVYCIKALCKNGGLSIASNNGTFKTVFNTTSDACNVPVLQPFKVVSATDVQLEWVKDPAHTGYVMEYREKNTSSWTAFKLTNSFKALSGLDKTKKYEYHVYAFCGLKSTDFSVTDTFSTNGPVEEPFVCGDNQGLLNITNRVPIASLKVGDKFTAAKFELTISVLSSSAPYSGEAQVKVPYLDNSNFIFGFSGVQVNEQRQMYEGKVYMKKVNLSLLDPETVAQITDMLGKVDAGFTTLDSYLTKLNELQQNVNGYISKAEGGNNVGKVVTGAVATGNTVTTAITNASQIKGSSNGSSGCSLTITGDDGTSKSLTVAAPSTLQDSKGTIFAVSESCSVSKVAELMKVPNLDLNALSDKATVIFSSIDKAKYGFSGWEAEYAKSTEWTDRYEKLGASYRVSSKLIAPELTDVVKASITISDATTVSDKSKVIFMSGKGVKFASKLSGDQYEITLVGGPHGDAQEIYAIYPTGTDTYISLGKLLIPAYKAKKRTLVLVPVNGITVNNEQAVQTKLNKIYNQYNVTWEVIKDANFTDNTWDNNGTEGLQVEGSGTFSTLTDEMKALTTAYSTARTIDPTNIYLFVLNKAETAGVDGDMPRAKQFGYLFTDGKTNDAIAHTAAHEVAHGLFLLRHTFDGYDMAKNALPSNLMDYAGGEQLAKLQWDVMHDPGIVLGVFERDEDGMAQLPYSVSTILTQMRTARINGSNAIFKYSKIKQNGGQFVASGLQLNDGPNGSLGNIITGPLYINFPKYSNSTGNLEVSPNGALKYPDGQFVIQKGFKYYEISETNTNLEAMQINNVGTSSNDLTVLKNYLLGACSVIDILTPIHNASSRGTPLYIGKTWPACGYSQVTNSNVTIQGFNYPKITLTNLGSQISNNSATFQVNTLSTISGNTITLLTGLTPLIKISVDLTGKTQTESTTLMSALNEWLIPTGKVWPEATYPITSAHLNAIFPNTPMTKLNQVSGLINKFSETFSINTPLRMSNFLGQIAIESDQLNAMGTKTGESGCYGITSLAWDKDNGRDGWIANKTWGEPPIEIGCDGYAVSMKGTRKNGWDNVTDVPTKYICNRTSNPGAISGKNLFSYVYRCEGGNGNEASEDGFRYRGHGIMQLTWKKNYVSFDAWLQTQGFEADYKQMLSDPDIGFSNFEIDILSAMWYWDKANCNAIADTLSVGCTQNSFDKLTIKINNGLLETDQRKIFFEKSYSILPK